MLKYKDGTFPLNVRTDIYRYFIDNAVNCHWHHDFEYGVLLDGNVDYYINGTHMSLVKGDIFFVNSNILHMSKQNAQGEDAVIYTLTFPASLLSANVNSSVYEKYFQPLLNTRIEGFKINAETPLGGDIKKVLTAIYELDPASFGYELMCLACINSLWLATLNYMDCGKDSLIYGTGDMRHSQRVKEILSYIHTHFNEKITAVSVAGHVNISRGECFRCFKHFMNQTLVEYINEYRLQRAAKLLRETEKSVIGISEDCGFENASYFSKMFGGAYSMTPLQYRKAQIWTENTVCNINSYDYEYWKDSGNGTMIITSNADNGSFSCKWHGINSIIFRSGKKFNGTGKTHNQLGIISLEYDAAYSSDGNSYLCVYGWTVDPLIEWYIVECYTAANPSFGLKCLGEHNIDGGLYELYSTQRINQPSILGVKTFSQYWSVRTSCRQSGTVDVSSHIHAWEGKGLLMGSIAEVSLCVESWKSSGAAAVNTNILTIARKTGKGERND